MTCLIVGSGPAALIAADLLSAQNQKVLLFEKRPAPGWKLLVAGASGLNVSHEGEDLSLHYTNRQTEVAACLEKFSREDWLAYLHGLGEETFLGTSRRYFLRQKKATSLLSSWVNRLKAQEVDFIFGEELTDFSSRHRVELTFSSGRKERGAAALLALGGASWENQAPLWPAAFQSKGINVLPFAPANAGYSFRAPPGFFERAQGLPIKGLRLQTAKGEKIGECMITRYGLEGTPVYSVGCPGPAFLDLKPDLSRERLAERIAAQGFRAAKLSPGASLLFRSFYPEELAPEILAERLKRFPIELLEPRPLSESISSCGGLSWDELNPQLELKKYPGIFCAGEMVDWDAPTGGFLLQACVSMGAVAANGLLNRIGTGR